MTDRLREYIYWLACVIAVVWLALGVVDIGVGLGRDLWAWARGAQGQTLICLVGRLRSLLPITKFCAKIHDLKNFYCVRRSSTR